MKQSYTWSQQHWIQDMQDITENPGGFKIHYKWAYSENYSLFFFKLEHDQFLFQGELSKQPF